MEERKSESYSHPARKSLGTSSRSSFLEELDRLRQLIIPQMQESIHPMDLEEHLVTSENDLPIVGETSTNARSGYFVATGQIETTRISIG